MSQIPPDPTPPPLGDSSSQPTQSEPSKEQRTRAMLVHLSSLAGNWVPFGGIIGPLVVWMMFKNEMPFVDEHGKEAINFQLTLFIGVIIALPLCCVYIGFFLLAAIWVVSIIMAIIAAIAANDGQHYRYPFTIRFIK